MQAKTSKNNSMSIQTIVMKTVEFGQNSITNNTTAEKTKTEAESQKRAKEIQKARLKYTKRIKNAATVVSWVLKQRNVLVSHENEHENDIITVSSDESEDESEDVNSIITVSSDESEDVNSIITVSSDEKTVADTEEIYQNNIITEQNNIKHEEGYEKWEEAEAEAHIKEYENRLQEYERAEQEERAKYIKWLEMPHVTSGDESGSDDESDSEHKSALCSETE